jgi:uncharacterized protein DUF4124
VLACLAAFAGQAAVIYKWTDSDGVVHYSDQPVPGAEKIYTAGSSPSGAQATAGRSNTTTDTAAPGAKKPAAPRMNYAQFSITSPQPDQTFYGDETVSVHLALEPGLRPDQTITWHLNGKQLDDQAPNSTQLTLPRLDRGAYVIAATITDQETGESLTTDSVSFYVRQPSELSPQHKKP